MEDSTQTLIAAAVFIGAAAYTFFLLRRVFWRRHKPGTKAALDTQKHIIVDGSNVMYWGGEPSILVLVRVLEALVKKGLTPIVYFDANVGYKLWDHYASDVEMAAQTMLKLSQIFVAPKGVTADEILLKSAVENRLRVVSNDRFQDWRVQFPRIGKKGFLVKGTWQQGSVILRGL